MEILCHIVANLQPCYAKICSSPQVLNTVDNGFPSQIVFITVVTGGKFSFLKHYNSYLI